MSNNSNQLIRPLLHVATLYLLLSIRSLLLEKYSTAEQKMKECALDWQIKGKSAKLILKHMKFIQKRNKSILWGFQRLERVVRQVVAPAAEHYGFIYHRIVAHWAEIIGEDLSNITFPMKLYKAQNGEHTLLLGVKNSSFILHIQAEQAAICMRIESYFGKKVITQIKTKIVSVK